MSASLHAPSARLHPRPPAPLTANSRHALLPRTRPPVLAALLVLAAILPQDLCIQPFGLMLTLPRLLLLLSAPVVVMRLVRKFSVPGSVAPCDVIVALTGAWMFIAVAVSNGPDRAVVGAGVLILELCGSYFLIRSSLNLAGEAITLAQWLALLIAVDGMLSILDPLTGRHILHDIAQTVSGYPMDWYLDYRNGFLRSQGMQEHPILLGTVCCTGAILSLVAMAGATRALVFCACLIGILAAISSAPLGAIMLGCALLIYGRATPGFGGKWRLLLVLGGLMLGLLLALHPTPFSFLINHLTIDKQTGYYRLVIWNLVGPMVLAHPFFGAGLETNIADLFGVSNSVDSIWLFNALRFGIVGSILIALVLITSCARPVAAVSPGSKKLARGIGIIIFLYIYLGFTVDYWGCTWIFLGVLAAMRVHLSEQPAGTARARLPGRGLVTAVRLAGARRRP